MGELNDLESAIVGLVQGVQINSTPAFKTAKGFASPRSSLIEEAIRRELKPAAYVTYDGRYSDVLDNFFHGQPMFSVAVAEDGHRGGAEPRRGGPGVIGAFDLMSAVTAALIDAVILSNYVVTFRNEFTSAADERFMMIRQQYIVIGPGVGASPTFGGEAVAGAESQVWVRPAEIRADRIDFAFPGVDGVFRHHLGLRERTIVWAGRLRAADDAELNGVESSIEALLGEAPAKPMVDGVGRTFEECVAERFVRLGGRRHEPSSGRPVQDFELHFTQLLPGS